MMSDGCCAPPISPNLLDPVCKYPPVCGVAAKTDTRFLNFNMGFATGKDPGKPKQQASENKENC